MSDFLKKFKGIFVEEAESNTTINTTSTPPPVAQASTPAAIPAAPAPVSNNVYSTTRGGNEKYQEILLSALERNNQPGFDYFEYRESLKNLAKMPLDEKTRYQSAFAMAQTMGATPDNLNASAQHYVGVLRSEMTKFEEAHAQQRSRLIGEREAEDKNLEAVIQNKAEQLKQLTKDIEESTKRREAIRTEIEQSTQKIEQTKSDFEATFAVVVSQIEADLSKMREYLK
jgi:chromosome segregation ATPase